MAEFIATGRITLEGVIFYIRADNLECAKSIAMGDQYEAYDIDCASVIDADVAVASVKENV